MNLIGNRGRIRGLYRTLFFLETPELQEIEVALLERDKAVKEATDSEAELFAKEFEKEQVQTQVLNTKVVSIALIIPEDT